MAKPKAATQGGHLPPLNAVRAFECAARHLSFTQAARELLMTQAAVSYQIKQLEQRVGTPLFQRLPRQVVLTPAGERLAAAAREALDRLRAAFTELSEGDQAVLVVTALPTVAASWLAPRLGAFQLAHPALTVRLDTSVEPADLLHHEADVAIRSGAGQWPGWNRISYSPTYSPRCAAPGCSSPPAGPGARPICSSCR